jgi:murein DD-endopeptidase MepM/ murein hydrolase activator NlpD
MQTLSYQWLTARVRVLAILALVGGSLLPPYVPDAELADEPVAIEAPQLLLVEDGFLMKTSSLTKQGSRRAYAEGIVHTVEDGDSFEKIAQQYGITVDTIRWANKLDTKATLRPGMELVILPVDGVLHTVARGQTLTRIAELYGISAVAIAEQNHIAGSFILAGQELIIPGGKPILPGTLVAGTQSRVDAARTGPPGRPVPPPRDGAKAVETHGLLQMPCNDCGTTQGFREGHYAVDLQTKGGGPIFAAEAGTVSRAEYGWNGGYGNVIEIDHGNGLVTLYGHNKELYVREGNEVKRGQEIASMGNTGRVYGKTGIHIHFEVRVDGTKKNPMLYLQ